MYFAKCVPDASKSGPMSGAGHTKEHHVQAFLQIGKQRSFLLNVF